MKAETDTRCLDCWKERRQHGALFSIAGSKIQQYLGIRVYKCDLCKGTWIFRPHELTSKS